MFKTTNQKWNNRCQAYNEQSEELLKTDSWNNIRSDCQDCVQNNYIYTIRSYPEITAELQMCENHTKKFCTEVFCSFGTDINKRRLLARIAYRENKSMKKGYNKMDYYCNKLAKNPTEENRKKIKEIRDEWFIHRTLTKI